MSHAEWYECGMTTVFLTGIGAAALTGLCAVMGYSGLFSGAIALSGLAASAATAVPLLRQKASLAPV